MNNLVLIGAFLMSGILFMQQGSAKVVERIVAVVNDEIVLQSDLDDYRQKLTSGNGLIDSLLLEHIEDPTRLIKNQEALVSHLIDEKILDSEVKKRGLSITIEQVERKIREIAAMRGVDRAELIKFLKAQGIAFSDYQDFIKMVLARQSLVSREVSSQIKISDEDISSYYISKQADISSQIFEYTLAHILFLPKNGGEAEAKAKAERVLKQLSEGGSFEKLAAQYSEDPGFSHNGLLGTFKAGELAKPLENAVRGLQVGQTSGVVKSPMGYHVVKLLKKNVVPNPAFEKEKEGIRNLLFARAFKRQLRQWLDHQRQDAFIRIN